MTSFARSTSAFLPASVTLYFVCCSILWHVTWDVDRNAQFIFNFPDNTTLLADDIGECRWMHRNEVFLEIFVLQSSVALFNEILHGNLCLCNVFWGSRDHTGITA